MKASLTTFATVISSLRTLSKLCLAALALLVPLTALGQTTGSLPVRVFDPNGAVIAGATVKVINLETGQTRDLMTDDQGAATFNLPPGRYTVEVSAPRFKRMRKSEPVTVGVGRADELPLQLEFGNAVETITVSGEAIEVEDVLRDLPNLNNDLTPLLQAVPGALAANPAALGRIVVDGKGKEQQILRLDSLDATPMVELPTGDPALGVLESLLKPNVALNSGKT